MRYTIALLLTFICAGYPATLSAQGPPAGAAQPAGRIEGRVIGAAEEQPIPSASVSVWSSRDSTLVTGALAGPDGAFRVEGLRPGQYYAKISGVGYETLTRDGISVSPADPRADLGAIQLATRAVELEGLTVTSEKREVLLAPDRNTYSIADMPAATGGTVVDVLRNVPAIQVEIDGQVSLRGNQNVVVQINGRPSPMRGEQLGNFLAQLPANMVSKVEVIPNPSAKYDPEGMAGIVNIVLKENTDLGTSGGFTLGAGTTGQVNVSGNVGHQQGPLTLFLNYGYMLDSRESTGFSYRENRYLDPLTFLEQDITGASSPTSHSVNATADLKLGERGLLGNNLVFSSRAFDRDDDNFYRELNAAGDLTGRYGRYTDGSRDDLTFDYALSYKYTVEPRENELVTELRFTRSGDDDFTRFTQQPLLADGTPANDQPVLDTNESDELSRNWALKADYTRALTDRTRLETGYKGTLRQLDNGFAAASFSYDAGVYLPDLERNNEFTFDEAVNAVYGVLSHSRGKFDLQGGLRLEHAATQFDLANTGESFDNGYTSAFPSGLVAYNLDDSRQVKLSYSKRIERPNTRLLNPFGFFFDPLNVFRGNPYLQPEYTHAFELGYQQSGDAGTLQVTPFYRHTTDAVRRFRTLDDVGVTTTTFENVATSDSYGTDVTGSLRLGPLSGFAGMSAFRAVTDGSNLNTDVSNDAFGWSARANLTWRINPRLDVQSFAMYRAPMDVEQGRIDSFSMLSFALRQKLLGDKASVSLRVVDPFDTMGFGFRTEDARFYEVTERRFGARGVFLSFSWNFGQQPRVRQRPAEQPDADRGGTPEMGIP